MLNESTIYDKLDELMAIDPKSRRVEVLIEALDYVLERIDELETEE